jgi:DNA polymerase-3 subunit delta'
LLIPYKDTLEKAIHMRFKDIIGQEAIKNKLIQTVKDNRISHAQLFLGPEGSGSLALALAYAQFINCTNRLDNDSCGECPSCRKYSKMIHPDLHFSFPFYAKNPKETAIDYLADFRSAFLNNSYMSLNHWRDFIKAENKQANINIAECHQIIQSLSLKPFEAEYKVLIIWLPEYLGRNGNSLLKLIEEPAQKTLFLLVAQNPDLILTTILSRTQLVKINRPNTSDIDTYLMETYSLSEEKAKQIAFLSEGNLEKALTLIDEKLENSYYDLYRSWILLCYKGEGLALVDYVEKEFPKMGRENQKSFLFYAINIMREVLLFKNNLSGMVHLTGKEEVIAERFSELFSHIQIETAIGLFEEAIQHIERNANPKILFLDVSLQLLLLFKYQTLPKGTQYI